MKAPFSRLLNQLTEAVSGWIVGADQDPDLVAIAVKDREEEIAPIVKLADAIVQAAVGDHVRRIEFMWNPLTWDTRPPQTSSPEWHDEILRVTREHTEESRVRDLHVHYFTDAGRMLAMTIPKSIGPDTVRRFPFIFKTV
jgi:hypothetical protein